MSVQTRMTSPTGSRRSVFSPQKFSSHNAYSFFEVMVALAIFTLGVVFIYKALFQSMNYVRHLNYRLYASMILDNRIQEIQRMVRSNPQKFLKDPKDSETVAINGQMVQFNYLMDMQMVDGINDGFEMTLQLNWIEGDHEVSLSRSTYITQYLPPPSVQ